MKKINELSASQRQDLDSYREEWLQAGRSTQPSDRATTEAVIRNFYERMKWESPIFWWSDGPAVGSLARLLLRANLGANLEAHLRTNLGANLGENLEAHLRANLEENLGANLGEHLEANLWEHLEENLSWHCWGQHDAAWPAFYAWPHLALRAMY